MTGVLAMAMPRTRRAQKLQFSFDEDDLSLAWDAVRLARLPAGTPVAAADLVVPAWFWRGTGLTHEAGAARTLRAIATTAGPSVVLHEGAIPDVEPAARELLSLAPVRNEAQWQQHRLARDTLDTENDFPLGAFVTPARHEQVTSERMQWGSCKVASWTRIEVGAAPTEFVRLQDAVGAYHVVLVEDGARRTVGIWAGAAAPTVGQSCEPVLRRLYRTQGAWRHGVKFVPLG